jgi:DNA polymerase-1
VLFGEPGHPTNKETFEAMGGAGHVMADLILQYLSLHRRIASLEKKQKNRSNGTLASNVLQQTSSKMSDEQAVVEGDPLLLVDASAYIWLAYFSMPPLHCADGMPVVAALGFCDMLNGLVLSRMMKGECPWLVLVFDAKGKNFRHDLYDDYKPNWPECPMDLIPQFDLIREATEVYGIHQLEAPNFEACDVIATLVTMALKEGMSANILLGDHAINHSSQSTYHTNFSARFL